VASAAAARAELQEAGFVEIDAWEPTLQHRFGRAAARAFFVEYDRAEELAALSRAKAGPGAGSVRRRAGTAARRRVRMARNAWSRPARCGRRAADPGGAAAGRLILGGAADPGPYSAAVSPSAGGAGATASTSAVRLGLDDARRQERKINLVRIVEDGGGRPGREGRGPRSPR